MRSVEGAREGRPGHITSAPSRHSCRVIHRSVRVLLTLRCKERARGSQAVRCRPLINQLIVVRCCCRVNSCRINARVGCSTLGLMYAAGLIAGGQAPGARAGVAVAGSIDGQRCLCPKGCPLPLRALWLRHAF